MPLSPQEVASKVFGPTRMRRGYDENEVDAFLDVVEAELTRLTTENERLRRELEATGRSLAEFDEAAPVVPPVAPAAVPPVAIAPTPPVETPPAAVFEKAPNPVAVPVAPVAPVAPVDEAPVEQRVTRMLVLAQQTADAAVQEAQTDAEQTRSAARADAERVISEARARAAEVIGSLERSKAALEGEVEHLQAFEREYRQRLRAYLSMQLNELEQAKVGPFAVEGSIGGTPGISGAGTAAVGAPTDAEPVDADPLKDGLSDPPGFGAVWSPNNGASQEGGAPESEGNGSSDSGGQGQPQGFGSTH